MIIFDPECRVLMRFCWKQVWESLLMLPEAKTCWVFPKQRPNECITLVCITGLGKFDIVSIRYQIFQRKFEYDEKFLFLSIKTNSIETPSAHMHVDVHWKKPKPNWIGITYWSWLKPKNPNYSYSFWLNKNKDMQCKDFWMFLVEGSQNFAFSIGRGILSIGFIKLAQTCCVSFSKLFAWFLFGYWHIWKLMRTRCKGNDWNWVKLTKQAITVRRLTWCWSQSDWQSSISSRE